MATIVYLDAEDEITSAASRIRAADDVRVGLVLPFGSRVATSRINFRLLAREAQANGRRLDIVAPDASARALAASAGLAVFGSVGEYESALDAEDAGDGPGATDDEGGRGAAAAGAAGAGLAGAAAVTGAGAGADDATRPLATPAGGTGATTPRPARPITEPASSDYGAPGTAGPARGRPRPDPQAGGQGGATDRRWPRRGLVVLALALVAAIGVGGVAAFTVLPSAEITVSPRIETVGPVAFTVVADPDVSVVDPAAGVIPATTLEIPVTVEGEFEATGRRVEETKARGGVRFTNCDPSSAYSIPARTSVSTRGGIGFATDEEVFLPVAGISGTPPNLRVECTTSEVAVTAREAGPDGNVGAGQIRVVPARYNRSLLSVANPAATSGGTREEFPQVAQDDVDAALAQLATDGAAQFQVELENPDRIPPGTTVFPETAVLGELAPTVDPATLVGTEAATFRLGMTGTGTVQAADSSPVEAIAEERLQASISEGYELVPDSTRIEVGDGTVLDGVITFPVRGSALQVRPLDPAALERQVLGLSRVDAEAALAPFGDVVIVLWPDFVDAVPGMDARVSLTIGEAVPPAPTPTPAVTEPPPTEEPSSSAVPASEAPTDVESGEPVPSG